MIFILRDVSIIVLAIESIVVGIILALLLLELRALSSLLRDEIKPMLNSTQETMDTVRSTSQFVSKRVGAPIIAVSSFASGAKQTVSSLRRGVGDRIGGVSAPSQSGPAASAPVAPPPITPSEVDNA